MASKVIFTSLLFFTSVLTLHCSLRCHPHWFFLLCQSGGSAALLLPHLGGVASKVIFASPLFFTFSLTLHLLTLHLEICYSIQYTLSPFLETMLQYTIPPPSDYDADEPDSISDVDSDHVD